MDTATILSTKPWKIESGFQFLKSNWRAQTVLAVGYIGLSVFGALLAEDINLPSGFSPWYPPAGLAFAYLLFVGPRGAPIVLFARLLSIAATEPSIIPSEPVQVLLRAAVIVTCYTAGAWLFDNVDTERTEFKELGWFAAIGVMATPLAAGIGVVVIEILDGLPGDQAADLVRTFWLGDAVAITAIVPVALVLRHLRITGKFRGLVVSPSRRLIAAIQGVALIAAPVCVILIGDNIGALVAASVLPALWVASRNDPLSATVGILGLNLFISYWGVRYYGPSVELINLQLVMLVATLAALYVIALTRSSARHTADLLEQEYYRALAGRNETLARMATGIAHDLGNLMSIVVGSSQMLKVHPDMENRDRWIGEIEKAGRTAAELSSSLVKFATATGGSQAAIDISKSLEELSPLLEALAPSSLRLEIMTSGETYVRIDPVSFEQVVLNLMVNSVDAMEDSGSIVIDLTHEDQNGDQKEDTALLKVSDQGAGIDPDKIGKIFDPFFTTKGEKGSGIGLITVQDAVKSAGGTVEVESELEVGSTFSVRLPLFKAD